MKHSMEEITALAHRLANEYSFATTFDELMSQPEMLDDHLTALEKLAKRRFHVTVEPYKPRGEQ